MHIRTFTSVSSRIGPNRTKKTLRIVRLVVSVLPVSELTETSMSPRVESTLSTNVVSGDGFFSNSAFEGYNRPVCLSNLPQTGLMSHQRMGSASQQTGAQCLGTPRWNGLDAQGSLPAGSREDL